MDERVEEVSSISRIKPVRKLTFTGHRRERRELKYQLSQYQKTPKSKGNNSSTKEASNDFKIPDSLTVLNAVDSIEDIKKRIAFDRVIIMGDQKT